MTGEFDSVVGQNTQGEFDDHPALAQDKTPGYNYDSQQDFEDLYANAKAVGYSGLDQAQKDLFNQSYSKSIYARNGKTLKQAQDETDARADNAGLSLRSITGLVPAASSGLAGGIRAAYDDTTGNKLGAAWEGAKEAAGTSYNNAKAGRDISGFAADPTNYLMLVPGAGELNLFDKVPALAEKIPAIVKATKIPEVVGEVAGKALTKIGQLPGYIGSALTQGLSGAGATAASEALDPSEKVTPTSVAIGAGLGGALGGLSKGLSKAGYVLFPHRIPLTTDLKDNTLSPEQLQAHMEHVSFPYTMGKQQTAVNEWLDEAGNTFGKAVNGIPSERTQQTSKDAMNWLGDLETLYGKKYTPDEFSYYAASNAKYPRTIYPSVEKDRISKIIENKRLEDLRGKFPPRINEAQLDRAIKTKLTDLETKLDKQVKLTTPVSDIGSLTPPMDLIVGRVPRMDVGDFSKLRTSFKSYQDPNANTAERVNNYADKLVHDAITNRMESIPEYADAVNQKLPSGMSAKEQYRVSNILLPKVNKTATPLPVGIAQKLPLLFNNYVTPTVMYKLGHTAYPSLGSNALFRGISQYLQDNDQSDR